MSNPDYSLSLRDFLVLQKNKKHVDWDASFDKLVKVMRQKDPHPVSIVADALSADEYMRWARRKVARIGVRRVVAIMLEHEKEAEEKQA